jgi:hypothetical protein
MRQELLNYIKAQKFKNFPVSDEVPFSNSGTEMYLKNPKRIYVDLEQITQESFIPLLNAQDIVADVYTVRVFFTTDAKQIPSDYDSVVASIRLGKTVSTDMNFIRREVAHTTEYINDLVLTEFEFRFTNIT